MAHAKSKKGQVPLRAGLFLAGIFGLGTLAAPAPLGADPLAVTTASGVSASLYGKVQFDGIWNDNPTATVAAPCGSLLALPFASGTSNQPETQLSSAWTRLGLNLSGPENDIAKISGKIEVDGWGGNQASPAPLLRFRYAWGNLDFGNGFSLLAGQADDLSNAIAPPNLDSFVLWFSGHIGFRRPQLRLTQELPAGDQAKLLIAVAAAQPNGTGDATTGDVAGVNSPIPDFQARVSYARPLWVENKNFVLGITGLYGQVRLYDDPQNDSIALDEKAGTVDLQLPLASMVNLTGQGFVGSNLGNYLANIGQCYVQTATIASSYDFNGWGGWAALSTQVTKKLAINLGAGLDKITNEGLASGTPTCNATEFLNATYMLAPGVKLGLEYHHDATDYADLGEFSVDGGQFSVTYFF
jgi:hypothetical protein